MQGGVRAVEIVVVEKEREEGSALVTGVVRASVGPLASNGLDETFGLAIGLGPVRTSEAMLETELTAGLGEEFGTVGRAAVGEGRAGCGCHEPGRSRWSDGERPAHWEFFHPGRGRRKPGGNDHRWRRVSFRRRRLDCDGNGRRWRGRRDGESGPAS